MTSVFSYSIAVFFIIFISGCVVNLLKQHYIFQLLGIAFFFTYILVSTTMKLERMANVVFKELFYSSLPSLFGISACLISMTLGFWVFPLFRNKIKD